MEKLVLSDGLKIEPFDTSSKERRYLIITKEKKYFQISENLYKFIILIDGNKTISELSKEFAKITGFDLTEEDIERIIENFLLPNNLIKVSATAVEGEKLSVQKELAEEKKGKPPFLFHKPLFSYNSLKPLTDLLKNLFSPWVVILVILTTILSHYQIYKNIELIKKFEYSGYNYFLLYMIIFFSVFFHELGHSSASRKFNTEHGDIGIGLYLVFPAFYSDVTNTWKLPRLQRVVVDIGGIYFHLIFANFCYLIYYFTNWKLFMASFYAIDFMIFFSINPLFKFDGYWIVSDILGIPNLGKASFQFIKNIFYRLLKVKNEIPEMLDLKPIAKFFFVIYSLLSFSFTLFLYLFLVKMVPIIFENYPKFLVAGFSDIKKSLKNWDIFLFLNTILRLFFESMICIGLFFILKKIVTFLIKTINEIYFSLINRKQ